MLHLRSSSAAYHSMWSLQHSAANARPAQLLLWKLGSHTLRAVGQQYQHHHHHHQWTSWQDTDPGSLLRTCLLRHLLLNVVAQQGITAAHETQKVSIGHHAHGRVAAEYGVLLFHDPPQPPAAWWALEQDLIRRAAAGEHPRDALLTHLTPPTIPVPPTPGRSGERCTLCSRSSASRFKDPSINDFLASLFTTISTWNTARQPELPRVELSRYDLFHAHLFFGPHPPYPPAPLGNPATEANVTRATLGTSSQQPSVRQALGLLFHCAEYLKYDEERFPYKLGYCQVGAGTDLLTAIEDGSTLAYDERNFDKRNIVFFNGRLAALDAGPGCVTNSLLYPGVEPLRTTYEGDFGLCLAEVTYLDLGSAGSAGAVKSAQGTGGAKIFITA